MRKAPPSAFGIYVEKFASEEVLKEFHNFQQMHSYQKQVLQKACHGKERYADMLLKEQLAHKTTRSNQSLISTTTVSNSKNTDSNFKYLKNKVLRKIWN